jgi:hypothetical protein
MNKFIKRQEAKFMRKPIVNKIRREIRRRNFIKNPKRFGGFIMRLKEHIKGGKDFWTRFITGLIKRKPIKKIVKIMVTQKYRPRKPRRINRNRLGRFIRRTDRVIGRRLRRGLRFINGKKHHTHGRGVRLETLHTRRIGSSFAVNVKLDQVSHFTLGIQNRRPRRGRSSWKGLKRGEWAFF